MLHRLESEKARSAAQAQSEAQSQVQDEVSRALSLERALAHESLQQALLRERIATEDENLRAQLLVSLLHSVNSIHCRLDHLILSSLFDFLMPHSASEA